MLGHASQYPRMVQTSSYVTFDETSVISKLKSPLHAATALAIRVTMDALNADVTAAKIGRAAVSGGTACSGGTGPLVMVDSRIPSLSRVAVEAWMEAPESVFSRISQSVARPAVFRASQSQHAPQGASSGTFHPVSLYTIIVDAMGLNCPLPHNTWATIVYLRCGTHAPFTDEDMNTLQRIQPVVADVVRASLIREQADSPADGTSPTGGSVFGSPMSLEQMLDRLTPTEQHVLRQLRTSASEKAIAEGMHRSPHTIHVHVKNIYRKLNVGSRRQIADMFGPFGGED